MFEPLMVPVGDNELLHLERIYTDPEGMPLFMIHGAVENGRIFYSESGKGLGPYLARNGYDVYVGDLRGRGESLPHVSRASRWGQTQAVTEDIPAFINKIIELRGRVPLQGVCHSWGGVLTSACLARFPRCRELVRSLVYFGSKRRVRARTLAAYFLISFVWLRLSRAFIFFLGYLPSRALRLGSDDESDRSHWGCKKWVEDDPWIDTDDGFDYGAAVRESALPPILYLAAKNDPALGHPSDVRLFMEESGQKNGSYRVLGREYGNLHDYDHVSMVTHPDAESDHYPLVLEWLDAHRRPSRGR